MTDTRQTQPRSRPHRSPARKALGLIRGVGSRGGSTETSLRSVRNFAKFAVGRPVIRRDFYASRSGSGERFGVAAVGGCDVRTVVGAGPALSRRLGAPLCIGAFRSAPESRSDLLLQGLQPPEPALTAEVTARLGLSKDYFRPYLFDNDFTVPKQVGLGRWPIDVVVLSISSDVGRVAYRHKEHGFLVDPGGWWLAAEMGDVLGDLGLVKWFAANFAKTSRIGVEESMANFESIVAEIRARTGAFVVFLNVLTVDPGSTALEYKHANSPNRLRRREFKEALAYLGQKMDFPVLDVDRLAKQLGISGQADFVHYTQPQKRLIGREFAGILSDAGVVPGIRPS